MKTVNGIIGGILAVLGVIFLLGAAVVGSGICSTSNTVAALTQVQTCGQATVEILGLLVVGLAFLIAGGIALIKGREKKKAAAAVPPSQGGGEGGGTPPSI